MTGISRKLSRRVVIAAPLGGLAAASVAGLTAHAEPGAEALERRIFTAAYEDMTNGAERLRQLADRFGQAGVDEIAVSIGRIERALFPWEGQVPPPSEPQQDQVKEAIDALSGDGAAPRPVILLLDALIPELIKENPELYVYADRERIQQVISNLIVNSIKYGKYNGTTEVSIEYIPKEKIAVRITDNGEGVAKENLPRLFERFYRVNKSGNRKEGGSGLGLSIVKHIIEAHKQKIYVDSVYGVGSEFSFTLDVAKKDESLS